MSQITIPVPSPAKIRNWAIRSAIFILVICALYAVRAIWLPLGLAFLLATVLDPVVDRMEQRGWNRTWATAFIFGSFLIILGGLLVLATPYLLDQGIEIQKGFTRYFPDTSRAGMLKSFHKMSLPDTTAQLGLRIFEGIQTAFQRSSSWLTEYGMSVLSNLVWVVIIPIVGFYALRDFHLILAKMLLLIPPKHRSSVEVGVSEVTRIFGRFLRGLAIVSGLNGLATWLLLMVLHVPSAFLLGMIAGVLYSVPYIGAMLTIVLTGAVAFIGGGVSMLVTATVASMVMHQIVFDQIITPRILGGQVGLHPIISIVALLVGNVLLGIVGMILAVPVAACIQIAILALYPKLAAVEIPSEPGNMTDAEIAALAEQSKEEIARNSDDGTIREQEDEAVVRISAAMNNER